MVSREPGIFPGSFSLRGSYLTRPDTLGYHDARCADPATLVEASCRKQSRARDRPVAIRLSLTIVARAHSGVTIGLLDGSNVEIREHVGAENLFIFGLTAGEVKERQRLRHDLEACWNSVGRLLAYLSEPSVSNDVSHSWPQ